MNISSYHQLETNIVSEHGRHGDREFEIVISFRLLILESDFNNFCILQHKHHQIKKYG